MSALMKKEDERIIAGKMTRAHQWVRFYQGNKKAKNYRAIVAILAAPGSSLVSMKYDRLVRQVKASKQNAPHWLARVFFQGRSHATQAAYDELDGILNQSSSATPSLERRDYLELGQGVSMPWDMRQLG